jgi:hypothetical protein
MSCFPGCDAMAQIVGRNNRRALRRMAWSYHSAQCGYALLRPTRWPAFAGMMDRWDIRDALFSGRVESVSV